MVNIGLSAGLSFDKKELSARILSSEDVSPISGPCQMLRDIKSTTRETFDPFLLPLFTLTKRPSSYLTGTPNSTSLHMSPMHTKVNPEEPLVYSLQETLSSKSSSLPQSSSRPFTIPDYITDSFPNTSNGYSPQKKRDYSPIRRYNSIKSNYSTEPTSRYNNHLPSLAETQFPDRSFISRSPPFMDGHPKIFSRQRGTLRAMATSGKSIAIGSHHSVRIWDSISCELLYNIDLTVINDLGSKVRALAFVPSFDPRDDGRYLWIGLQNGALIMVDILGRELMEKRTTSHRGAVDFIFRNRNREIWTMDNHGILNIWPVQPKPENYHQPLLKPVRYLITPMLCAVAIIDSIMWTSSGRDISVFHRTEGEMIPYPRIFISKELGDVTNMVLVPFHKSKIFISHNNGTLSVWDITSRKNLYIIQLGKQSITAMESVGERYLWTGYTDGTISIHETRSIPWRTIQQWQAHESSVFSIRANLTAFTQEGSALTVVTADNDGNIGVWDGLLKKYWKEKKMQEYRKEYCVYRDTHVLNCSWNVDAMKPDKLSVGDQENIMEWLSSQNKPDIIAIGMQEMVDLSSKTNTARILLNSYKKTEPLQDTNELLSHRYKLWYEYLSQVIEKIYGVRSYSVIKTEHLVGLFSCIFVKSTEEDRVRQCEATVIKTGLKFMKKSVHGNKGAVAIRFLYDHTSFCFVNCHLAAGQNHLLQRNEDSQDILDSARFGLYPSTFFGGGDLFTHGTDGSQILDHEVCFWSGDLNYRINLGRERVLEHLGNPNKLAAWDALQAQDQLTQQRQKNPMFALYNFTEPPLMFDPTYKYDVGTQDFDSSEKKRIPAWCDRVLVRAADCVVKNTHYRRHEVLASDHRPVSAAFYTKVKQADDNLRDTVAKKVDMEWYIYLVRFEKERKARYVADYGLCSTEKAIRLLDTFNGDVTKVVSKLFLEKEENKAL
ncbi:Endonuclease/exonuclease/phosphatase [Phycomyces blakesleeanus]|uniref:Endonuclease/exonuclease/phosphatase n=2 Tax=Phycomyces blakesleeanus TaxID=4837 RepID=A0ABR3AYT7_PHYBL